MAVQLMHLVQCLMHRSYSNVILAANRRGRIDVLRGVRRRYSRRHDGSRFVACMWVEEEKQLDRRVEALDPAKTPPRSKLERPRAFRAPFS